MAKKLKILCKKIVFSKDTKLLAISLKNESEQPRHTLHAPKLFALSFCSDRFGGREKGRFMPEKVNYKS